MSARVQLNAVYALGSVSLALLMGLFCQSWLAFFVVMVILLTVCLANGTIRPPRRRR